MTAMRTKGTLEVICGSMFSGKTEELMRRLKRAEYAKKRVLTLKHHIDTRHGESCVASISSHDGRKRVAFPINGSKEELSEINKLAHDDADIIGIDEVQFFSHNIISVIHSLIDQSKRVIVAGLDLDFRGEPFSFMPQLLCLADHILKLKAICVICGKEAHYSQRLINHKPARYNDPTVMVGATELYQARCRDCFVMVKPTPPAIVMPAQKTTAPELTEEISKTPDML